MEIGKEVEELLEYFLRVNVKKVESRSGKIKIYRVGDELVRIDIKRDKPKLTEEI